MSDVDRVERGTLWWYDVGNPDAPKQRGILGAGGESKARPVLIISEVSNTLNTCTVQYLPLTSHGGSIEEAKEKFYEVICKMPGNRISAICCNQIGTLVTNHLQGYIGRLRPDRMKEVEAMMCKWLGMSHRIYRDSNSIPEEVPEISSSIPVAIRIEDILSGTVYNSKSLAAKETGLSLSTIHRSIQEDRPCRSRDTKIEYHFRIKE